MLSEYYTTKPQTLPLMIAGTLPSVDQLEATPDGTESTPLRADESTSTAGYMSPEHAVVRVC